MWPNSLETADLVTFTEETFSRKLHFLRSVTSFHFNVSQKTVWFAWPVSRIVYNQKSHFLLIGCGTTAIYRSLNTVKLKFQWSFSTYLNSHANWKSTDKLSLTYFKGILKTSHTNQLLPFYCLLPMKFAIFLKSSLLFNSFCCFFCL